MGFATTVALYAPRHSPRECHQPVWSRDHATSRRQLDGNDGFLAHGQQQCVMLKRASTCFLLSLFSTILHGVGFFTFRTAVHEGPKQRTMHALAFVFLERNRGQGAYLVRSRVLFLCFLSMFEARERASGVD